MLMGLLSTVVACTLQERRSPRPPSSTASTNTAFSSLCFKSLLLKHLFSCLSVEKSCCYLKLPQLSYSVAVFRFGVLACAQLTGMSLLACTLLKWLRNLNYKCGTNTLEIPPFYHTCFSLKVWDLNFVPMFFFCLFFSTNRNAHSHR